MDVLSLLARLSLDSTEYDTGLKNAESRSSSFASKLSHGFDIVKTGAKIAFAAAETAVTAFAASAIRAGSQFDASMAQVAATMGMTTEQMQKQVGEVDLAWGHFSGNLREYAQEMGAHTAFSASQAAQALNYMALAGYDAQTSMSMLPNVLNLAAAGGIELAQASDMVTDAQSALGLSLERTSTLVSEMAKTASRSNTSVEQLGSAILTVGGTARQLHGGMIEYADGTQKAYDGTTELSAALGLLADNGIKGAEGGTALRNVLTTISGKKFDKTFGQMGVAVYDASGEMRSLKDILTDMNAVMDGMTTQEKTNLIQNTFDARVLKSANALLGTTTERWNELTEAIIESQGAAEEMAETQLDNLQGDITMFKSALEGAQIAISDGLTPTLREFTKFGAEGLQRLTEAIKEGGLTSAMETLGDIIADGVDMIVDKLPEYVEAGTQLLTSVINGFTKNASKFAEAAASIIKSLLSAITENLPTLLQAALEIVEELANGIIKALPEMIPAVVSMIEKIVNLIIEHAPKLIEAGVELIVKLADGLVKAIPKLVPAITKAIATIIKTIVKNAPKILKAVGDVIKSVVTEVGKLSGVEGIIGKVALAFGAIKLPMGLIGGVSQLTGGITSGFKGIGGVLTAFNDKMKGAESAIGGFFSNLKTGVSDGMQNFHTQMEAGNASVGTFVSSMKDGLSGQFGSLKDKINGFSDKLSVTAKGLLAIGGATASIMGVSDAFTKLADNTENATGAILEMGASVGTSAASFIAAFGVPGGLVATAIGALIGLIKGVNDHIEKINMKKAEDAIIAVQGSIEGATHSFQDYADAFGVLTSGIISNFETMRGKFENLGEAKGTIGEVVDKIGSIGTAMQASAQLSQEQISNLMSSYDELNNKLGEYISSYYDFAIQQMMIDKNYELSRKDLTDAERQEIEDFYSEKISLLYQERDAELQVAADATKAAQERTSALNEAKAKEEELAQAYTEGKISGTAYHEQQKAAHKEVNELTKEQGEIINQVTDLAGKYISAEEGMGAAIDDSASKFADFQEKLSGSLRLSNSEIENGFEGTKTSVVEAVESITGEYVKLQNEATADLERTAKIHGEESEEYKRHAATIEEQMAGYTATYKEYMQSIQDEAKEFGKNIPQTLIDQGMNPNDAYKKAKEFSKVFGADGLGGAIDQAISETGVEIKQYGSDQFETALLGMFDFNMGSFGQIVATRLKPEFQTGIDQSFDGLDEYASGKMENVFAGVPEGGAKGITDNLDSITGAVFSMGDTAEQAGRDRLGINSPSRVFQEQGASIVEGMNKGIEDNMDSTTTVMQDWVDSIANAVSGALDGMTDGFKEIGKNISNAIQNGIEKAKETLKTKIVKPIKDALKNIEKQYAQYKTAGQKLIQNLITGFTSKANDLVSKAKDIANKVYKALTDKNWTEVGKRISEGVQKGIESGKSGVIQAAVEMATAAYEAAKKALEIASPSKKTMGLGKFLAQGLAEGISRNKDEAVQAMEQMSSELLSEAEKRLENYEKFNNISLQQEVKYWTEIRKLLSEGTQAYLDATEKIRQAKLGLSVKDATLWSNETDMAFDMWLYDAVHDLGDVDKKGKKNGMSKGERAALLVDTADQRMENRKKLYGMTEEEELAYMEQVLEMIPQGTQEWIDYYDRVGKKREEVNQKNKEETQKNWEELAESAKSAFSLDSLDLHSPFGEFLEDTTSDLAQYSGVIKKAAETDEEYGQEILSAAKKRLDNWEAYNQMTNAEKKAFWEEIKKTIPEGTQAMIDVDKIIMDIGDDIQKEAEDASKSVQKLINDLNTAMEKVEADRQKKIDDLNAKYEKYYEDREKLDRDYQRNLENINQKEIDDIKNLEKAYRDSVESSKNSIMGMTGLFNRVSYDKTWNSDYLLDSLQQQVEALTDWDSQLDTLEKKLGSDNALYKEIEAMGISGLYTLKEINGMSDDELAEYNRLYAKKVEIATNRAEDQAKELRKQTDADIRETKDGAEENRKTLKAEYDKSCEDLKKAFDKSRGIIIESERQAFYETTSEYRRDYEKINSDAKAEMNKLQNQFNNDFKALAKSSQTNGETVGNAIIDGIQTALTNGSTVIGAKVKEIVDAALKDAQSTIQVTPKTGGGSGVSTSAKSGWSTAKELGVSGTKVTDLGNGMTKVTRFNASSNSTKTGTVTQNITINSPTPLKPSEVARQVKNTTQQTVLKLAGAV